MGKEGELAGSLIFIASVIVALNFLFAEFPEVVPFAPIDLMKDALLIAVPSGAVALLYYYNKYIRSSGF